MPWMEPMYSLILQLIHLPLPWLMRCILYIHMDLNGTRLLKEPLWEIVEEHIELVALVIIKSSLIIKEHRSYTHQPAPMELETFSAATRLTSIPCGNKRRIILVYGKQTLR